VVDAAIAILVAGGSPAATAAITLIVASLFQSIADDVFELRAAVALALPIPVAVRLTALTGFIHNSR
jgi:hypothetical protein